MKLKTTLMALLLIIGTTLMAQEKYEQAVVIERNAEVLISIENQEYKEKKVKPWLPGDYSALLKEVAEMRQAGWEIWNSTGGVLETTYFLRRKLK